MKSDLSCDRSMDAGSITHKSRRSSHAGRDGGYSQHHKVDSQTSNSWHRSMPAGSITKKQRKTTRCRKDEEVFHKSCLTTPVLCGPTSPKRPLCKRTVDLKGREKDGDLPSWKCDKSPFGVQKKKWVCDKIVSYTFTRTVSLTVFVLCLSLKVEARLVLLASPQAPLLQQQKINVSIRICQHQISKRWPASYNQC